MSDYDELPKRLKNKIRTPAHAGDCWLWEGSVRRAAPRLRSLGPAPEPSATGGRPRGRPRTVSQYLANEKATPQVHSPQKGYPVPACREVYSIVKGIPYDALPRLTHCKHDLCVNPDHQIATSKPSPKTGRRVHLGPSKGTPTTAPTWSQEQILDALKLARPYSGLDPKTAAEEAGCPMPDNNTWSVYQTWDQSTPD